jgi:hypothetical protein
MALARRSRAWRRRAPARGILTRVDRAQRPFPPHAMSIPDTPCGDILRALLRRADPDRGTLLRAFHHALSVTPVRAELVEFLIERGVPIEDIEAIARSWMAESVLEYLAARRAKALVKERLKRSRGAKPME